MKIEFTKRKFLQIPLERQHQKCAELLRYAYEELLRGSFPTIALQAYQEITTWLTLPLLPADTLKAISDRYHFHLQQALIKHKEHNLLPSIRTGDKEKGEEAFPICIYFDEIRSAHNVGSMLRTIEALSLGVAYFSDNIPPISNKQVQDAAMGTCQWVQYKTGVSLKDLQRPIIALETSPNAISLYEFIFPETFTLVVGNEEYGCSENTLEIADILIEIPMRGRKNSLNVANAFACVASEICRQRGRT